jgi:hypothetical protein
MVGSWCDMNQGSLFGERNGVHDRERSEEPYPERLMRAAMLDEEEAKLEH